MFQRGTGRSSTLCPQKTFATYFAFSATALMQNAARAMFSTRICSRFMSVKPSSQTFGVDCFSEIHYLDFLGPKCGVENYLSISNPDGFEILMDAIRAGGPHLTRLSLTSTCHIGEEMIHPLVPAIQQRCRNLKELHIDAYEYPRGLFIPLFKALACQLSTLTLGFKLKDEDMNAIAKSCKQVQVWRRGLGTVPRRRGLDFGTSRSAGKI